ncbi:MAG: hypothetical protein J6J61_06815 [Muribaculaceae bacterium]|nr:hypothetical protein [Muribaculaceae bacterium]
MAKITDLRQAGRPTMTLVLPDEQGTTIHLCAPTVELVEELREGSATLFAALRGEKGDAQTSRAVYELAANFINCNIDLFTTTAEELTRKYGVGLEHLQYFFIDYVNFLEEIQNAKN